MLNREEIIRDIEKNKIIVIMRGFTTEQLIRSVDAMEKGGIRLVEVTFDQKSQAERERTVQILKALNRELGDRMLFGAGTVTTVEMVQMAKDAGATFIISPDTCEEVIKATVEAGLVSIPGALTPTEIAQAHRFGADFVKVFPANRMGPGYIKDVAAPLSHVRMLAVGGVDGNTVRDYLSAGAVGAGVASCLFKKDWVKNGEWERITQASLDFTALL